MGRLCFLISKDMRTALDRSLAEFDLRAQQAGVLLQCCRLRGASPSYLASAVGTDTAGITGLIDQLEKRGLAIRRANPSDRRATIVEPTEKGRSLLPGMTMLEALLQRLRRNVEEQLKGGEAE